MSQLHLQVEVMLSRELVEAAALGDLTRIEVYTGSLDARASHPQLPDGTTMLMAASSTGQDAIVNHLLDRGATVNLHASGGVTALMFAVCGSYASTVKLLCAAGASAEALDLTSRDHVRVNGRKTQSRTHSALEMAEQKGDHEIAAILREHSENLRREADRAAASLLADEEASVATSISLATTASPSSKKRERDKKRREEKRDRLRRERVEQEAARTEHAGEEGRAEASHSAASLQTGAQPAETTASSSSSYSPSPSCSLASAPAAAVAAARRRGAFLAPGTPLPPTPPSTPQARRRAHTASLGSCRKDGGSGLSGMHDALSATASTATGSSLLDLGSVLSATDVTDEEYKAMEARAESKAKHMRELDEHFERMQLARATSSSSLMALGSSTSLASLADSGAGDENTCVICFENPTDATLVHGSSAHVCCCIGCAESLVQLDQSCPMCRKPIESVLRLYFA